MNTNRIIQQREKTINNKFLDIKGVDKTFQTKIFMQPYTLLISLHVKKKQINVWEALSIFVSFSLSLSIYIYIYILRESESESVCEREREWERESKETKRVRCAKKLLRLMLYLPKQKLKLNKT